MARRRQPSGRKRRTREHVIADLSVNFVERKVLECGYCYDRVRTDYGIDADVMTFDERGRLESGLLRLQLKATDSLRTTAGGAKVAQRVLVEDLKTWLMDAYPVILIVYDARGDRAFWLDVQSYVRERKLGSSAARTVTLTIPVAQLLTAAAVRELRARKNRFVSEGEEGRA